VAHDLKNPIHNIKSLSSFLKKNLENLQEIGAERKNQSITFINMIADTCDKAYTIIKDLLLIGEIELGKLNLKKQKTNLNTFIEPLLKPFELVAKEKNIGICFDCPAEPVYAQINREKFVRVIENLVSNAVKFTKTGGEVSVSLKKESERVILQVSDNGIGIPEPLQRSIFQKFTKANRQGTQGEATTGLGLYIVKQIVDLHKGKIWLESKENQGTCFYIELM
jgi:two-component system sensor histidine kinase VicK